MSRRPVAVTITALLFAASHAGAQINRERLRPATDSIAEGFSQIAGIRELSDGRVIVSDFRARRLVVVDFGHGTVAQIGREGTGPGEYPATSTLHRMGGDTTIVMVQGLRRWLLLDGATIVATLPPDHPAIVAIGGTRGASRSGDLTTTTSIPLTPGTQQIGEADSSLVIVANFFQPGRVDTIARVRRASTTRVAWTIPGEPRPMGYVSQPAFATPEEHIMFPDGWVAIARLDDYRVDWRPPGGPLMIGPLVAEPPTPVTKHEKEYYRLLNAAAMRVPANQLPEGTPSSIQKSYEAARQRRWNEFPASLPPYQFPALMVAPKGQLAVERTRAAASPYFRYDLFDRAGRVVRRVSVAVNQRIVGFGARSAYLVTSDDDGLEYLSRHPWP